MVQRTILFLVPDDSALQKHLEQRGRKVEAGKNKMLVLNAVRNKLIHRIFSCQRDKRMFVKKVA
jgi:hypothetical protein